MAQPPTSASAARLPELPTFGGRRNLRQEIAAALRGSIVAGELQPGELYSVPGLAERFEVSATPVREAMLDLAGEGLVIAVRNKGFRVTELSDRDLDEITALRLLIEVPTVRDVAACVGIGGIAPAAVDNLRPLSVAIEEYAVTGDLVAYVEADRAFHLALLELSGNTHLVEVVGNLRSRSRLYGLNERANAEQLLRSAKEHEQILDLILTGDATGVESLMASHIDDVRSAWARRNA
jgi:DNA-binding GntR family transcriptional regulator